MRCGYYVALTNIIVGHAGYMFDAETGYYEIVGVAIHKGSQRKGIGKSLLNTLCDQVYLNGGNQVMLYTLGHIGNENTLTFYRSVGYEQINVERNYFKSEYHRVTFMKKLD